MYSRGSINGLALNEIVLNGGNFVENASAAGTIGVAGAVVGVRRASGKMIGTVIMGGSMRASKVASAKALGTLAVSGSAVGVRRAVMTAGGSMAIDGSMTANRRAVMTSSSTIAITGKMRLDHKILRRAADERIMVVMPEARGEFVPYEHRLMHANTDYRQIVVPAERRVA